MIQSLPTYLLLITISGTIGFQIRAKADPALDTLACAESALQSTQHVFETLQFWK